MLVWGFRKEIYQLRHDTPGYFVRHDYCLLEEINYFLWAATHVVLVYLIASAHYNNFTLSSLIFIYLNILYALLILDEKSTIFKNIAKYTLLFEESYLKSKSKCYLTLSIYELAYL